MTGEERTVRTETIRVRRHRDDNGSCLKLARSIEKEGLRRAVTVWSGGKYDCTLISGERRLFAHMLLKKETIQAVFVDTIEAAAKRMIDDAIDATVCGDSLAKQMTYSEMCRLWATMRLLDEPANALRRRAAKERGSDLRRKTRAGLRRPGRAAGRTEDYLLTVAAEPFGMSSASARRAERIYNVALGVVEATADRAEKARALMKDLDARQISVWDAYTRLNDSRRIYRPKQVEASGPATSARKQLSAWERGLPPLEGLIEGFVALGDPSPDLTWVELGPVHARLSAARRDLEKMIKRMKEINEP